MVPSSPETRKGILRGDIYPRSLVGSEVEVEVVDEHWGRCHAHSLWVRLDDLGAPAPAPAGGYVVGGPTSFSQTITWSVPLDPKLIETIVGEELKWQSR